MGGFLDYLDDYEQQVKKETQKPISKPKKKSVKKVVKENKQPIKKHYKIPKKKIIKNKIVETHNHAADILDGLSNEFDPNILENQNVQNVLQNNESDLDDVTGHASALL